MAEKLNDAEAAVAMQFSAALDAYAHRLDVEPAAERRDALKRAMTKYVTDGLETINARLSHRNGSTRAPNEAE